MTIFFMCLLTLALMLVACGGDANTPTSGTLNLFGVSPPTLDPALARTGSSLDYILEVFSGLVAFDPDLKLTPEIAETWDVSDDGTTYTFHLRDGVVFHDGRPVTASDFKYSLERACDPGTGSMTAESFLGDIFGVAERLAGAAHDVSGVKVLDDLTLEITIDSPKEYFPLKLAHPVAFVVDRYNVQSGPTWWTQPNGTGPFRLAQWEADELIVFRRNESYYLQAPRLDVVNHLLYSGVPIRMYEEGQIDVTQVGSGDIERVLDPTNPLHSQLHITPEFSLLFIGFNATQPPFDDADVRRAFAHAIDKDKLVQLVLKDLVAPAAGILPPAMPGYDESLQGLAFDPDLASRLLAQSSYGGPGGLPPIVLTTEGRGTASRLDAALVDMWRQHLEVEVEVRQLEPEKYADLLMEEKDEMLRLAWGADYPDPQSFLEMLFRAGAPDNFGEYSNAEVDALLDRASEETNTDLRLDLYRQAEQQIVADAACIPLYFNVSYTLVKPYVKDLPLTPLWMPTLKYASVDPA
jgi:oligopeptide transport system substrate-binding protein